MRLADVSIRRPVFAVMLVGSLVVLGVVSIQRLGVDLFPRVEFPMVTVSTVLEGASPETIEREVSQVLEESINTIEGIRTLSSQSTESLSLVFVEFELEYDIREKIQQVRDKVAAVRGELPRDLEPPVVDRIDPDAAPILAVMLAGPAEIRTLSELADKRLKPRTPQRHVFIVKGESGREARRAGLGTRFVGGHPMAGSERSGIGAASATLFDGAPWLLCPARRATGGRRAAARVERLVRRLGAFPVRVAERTHDRSVAHLSHLPQLLAVALVNAAGRGGRALAGTGGPAFAAMSRVALSPPGVWNGVLAANRREIARAIDDCVRELARLRAALDGRAGPQFRRAARIRRRLLDRRGAR